MFIIEEYNDDYLLSFKGNSLEELNEFHKLLKKVTYNMIILNNYPNYIISAKDKAIIESNTLYQDIGKDLIYEPYPYQKETIHYAINNPTSLLILPTGAGKSIIGVGIFNELRKQNLVDNKAKCLVVVKASLKYQWVKEVEKFSRTLRAKSIDTPSKVGKKRFDEQFKDVDMLIANYETLKNKEVIEKLLLTNIQMVLSDETQVIGNHKSGVSKALFRFNYPKYRYGTTATPITNNPLNLYSIFNFINKDVFKSYSKFSSNYIIWASFGRVKKIKNTEHMINTVKPYIFIKSEEDIAGQLPELIITQRYCDMTNNMKAINNDIMEQLDIYRKTVEQLETKLSPDEAFENKDYNTAKAMIMAYQTFAQELVDDPRLLSTSESKISKQFVCEDRSTKLTLCLDLVDEILSNGSKVAIFTKYARMQEILKDEIESTLNVKVAIINGSMSSEDRYTAAYTNFSDNDEYKVLILTEAGNAGISLVYCNYLIEYDLADSYASQTQRHGRIKRANSVNRTGYVYQLIVNESYDEIAQKIVSKKENYDTNIIKALQ